MGCQEMRDLMPLYAGAELESNEKVALESHLGMCAECSAEAAGFRECGALLSGLREVDPPSGTYDAIWRAVRNEFFPVRVHRASWGLAYAALLLIGVSVGFLVAATAADRAPSVDDSLGAQDPINQPVRPSGIHVGENTGPDIRIPRGFLPRSSRPSGSFYLPRVRMVAGDGEVDF